MSLGGICALALATALSLGAADAELVHPASEHLGVRAAQAAAVVPAPEVVTDEGAPAADAVRLPAQPELAAREATPPPPPPAVTSTFSGAASWYGPGFAGQRTASGEAFDPSALTAAHRSLPFGTELRVTNQANGRSVIVRVNDRGPYAGGRVLDVSSAAADVLGMKGSGVVTVTVEVLA